MKTSTVSIQSTYPSIDLKKQIDKVKAFLFSTFDAVKSYDVTSVSNNSKITSRFGRIKFPKSSFVNKLNRKHFIYIIAVLAILIIGSKIFSSSSSDTGKNEKIEISDATATQTIDREFSFPLKDGEGETISEIKYYIEKAELRDEIIVQGKRATAIKGRSFLIISVKVSNEYDQAINMNTKDYVRLSVNGNKEEWLAPDINNDPVEVQAISTKLTRVGFPINDTDTELVLRVGEIDGEKEEVPLTF